MMMVSITDFYNNQPLQLVEKSTSKDKQTIATLNWRDYAVKKYNDHVLSAFDLQIVKGQTLSIEPNRFIIKTINDFVLRSLNLKLTYLVKKSDSELNWNDYALTIPKSQLETLSMNLILEVLSQTGKSPTQLAQLKINEIVVPLLSKLDKDFYDSRTKYKKLLEDAEEKDLAKIKTLEASHCVKDYSVLSGWVFQGLQLCGYNYRSAEFIKEVGSAHRIKFLYELNQSENERIKKIKDLIDLALDPLIDNLNQLKAKDLVDLNVLKQAAQLVKVYKAVFPTDPLMKNGQDIDVVLAEFNF